MADKGFYVKLGLKDDDFRRKLDQNRGRVNGFASSMKSLGGIMAGAFSVAAVTAWAKASLQGLDAQQKAEQKLLTALKGRQDVQQELIRDAAELQKRSLFGDEQTIEAYAQLAAFVKNEEALKRLMPLIQDMATAFNMDLSQAAVLVGKSIGSSTNALLRYGIEIKGAVGSTDRLNSAVTALSDKFEGQAYAATQTALGAAVQLQNAWGDFGETLISFVGPALTQLAKGMNEAVSGMDAMVKSKSLSWWDKLRMTLGYASGSVGTVANVVGNNLDPEIENATDSVNQMTQATDELAGSLDDVGNKATATREKIKGFSMSSLSYGQNPGGSVQFGGQSVDIIRSPQGIQLATESLQGLQLEMRNTMAVESAFTDAHAGFAERMIEVSEEMAANVSSAFNLIAASMADAIADIITGEKTFDEALKSFANSVVRIAMQLLTTFLTQTIAASVAHGASKGGAIGAGIEGAAGAAAFGALVPSLQFLADGGIAYGPTPALIGEYPGASTNPEIVAPLSDLEHMLAGGGPTELRGKFRIEGSDLVYIVNKENSKLNRYR